MVVYADVLIFLNTIINYFIVSFLSKICKKDKKWYRYVLASLVGALFSLYIFLPKQNFILESAVKLVCSAVIVLIALGFENAAKFIRRSVLLYIITFLYAGFMMALWAIFKPKGMVIHNSVVYFDISPLFLIAFSAAIYFVLTFIKRIIPQKSAVKECALELFCEDKKIKITATVDTGNFVSDLFSDSDIIFLNEKSARVLFGELDPLFLEEKMKKRYRAIPCKTVDGNAVLNAFRCDKAFVYENGVKNERKSPIVVISKALNTGENSALISPEILENARR